MSVIILAHSFNIHTRFVIMLANGFEYTYWGNSRLFVASLATNHLLDYTIANWLVNSTGNTV